MRFVGFLGCLGLCLTLAGQGLGASSDEPGGGDEHQRLTILGDQAAMAEPPTILRGSAIGRKAPDPEPAVGPGRWQALAGRHLWLADPATREVVTCRLFKTTQVRERVVRCFEGDLPRAVARD